MKLSRMSFLLRRDIRTVRRLKWRIVEMLYFPITTTLIWGFFAAALRERALEAGLVVLIVHVFWNFAYFAQSTTNMQMIEDIWSGSLRQVLLIGVSPMEYILARIAFALILAAPLGGMCFLISLPFGLTLHGLYGQTAAAVGITTMSSVALAVLVVSAILVLGREYGFLAWTILQAFVLFSAPFNEPEVFPKVLYYVSKLMPFTDAFTIARRTALGIEVGSGVLVKGALIGLAYLVLAFPFYLFTFKRARRSGMLVKL